MTYSREKEFIRQHFMDGTLDLGGGFDSMKAFCEIMSGEMEAVVAISHAQWLTKPQIRQLLEVAQPTSETLREYQGWYNSIFQKKPARAAKS